MELVIDLRNSWWLVNRASSRLREVVAFDDLEVRFFSRRWICVHNQWRGPLVTCLSVHVLWVPSFLDLNLLHDSGAWCLSFLVRDIIRCYLSICNRLSTGWLYPLRLLNCQGLGDILLLIDRLFLGPHRDLSRRLVRWVVILQRSLLWAFLGILTRVISGHHGLFRDIWLHHNHRLFALIRDVSFRWVILLIPLMGVSFVLEYWLVNLGGCRLSAAGGAIAYLGNDTILRGRYSRLWRLLHSFLDN